MSDGSKIEWTDATWNPITGCSVVSAGCKHCYAMRLAGTRLRHHPSRAGLTRDTSAGPVWTGEVRLNDQWLDQPLRWKKPRRIFVCAHGDLFHESVPDEWIDQVFAVMALAPRHTFQVLTKRPERMRDYIDSRDDIAGENEFIRQHINRLVIRRGGAWIEDYSELEWPLPNVWLGVSVEDHAAAEERIPLLLQTPAAVRFISAEPLLVALDILRGGVRRPGGIRLSITTPGQPNPRPGLDWVIAGGESGPGARPSHPDWFRSLRDQCQAAGVAFFFKQWGEWAPDDGRAPTTDPHFDKLLAAPTAFAGNDTVYRIGKRAAGRLLDGREWNEFPAPP